MEQHPSPAALENQAISTEISYDHDVFLVLRDFELCSSIQEKLAGKLSVASFPCEQKALEVLKDNSPSALVLEWSMKNFDAVEFLISLSELMNWGETRVFFVSPAGLTTDEVLQMATLGVDHCFQRDVVIENGVDSEFYKELLSSFPNCPTAS